MRTVLNLVVALTFMMPSLVFSQSLAKEEGSVRIATYNTAMNRKKAGALQAELEGGKSTQARAVAEVIQRVRPDVLLINEIDYDKDSKSAKLFIKEYLGKPQGDQKAIEFTHHYIAPVNTGVRSGLDLDNNEKTTDPNDAFGFGRFSGQYGMLVLSNLEIDKENVRSFQKFLWKDMPGALWPVDPETKKSYYSDEAKKIFRLSSKSHWDVPLKMGGKTLHFLVCHPTPPVFDKEEDRNGRRNHDEIRLWSDYVSGKSDYLYDDAGRKGGLGKDAHFVIAGDLNADPLDGDQALGAIQQLLENELVNDVSPKSTGGAYWSREQGGVNEKHKGDPAFDTGDWKDKGQFAGGNARVDYVLPSKTLAVTGSGVFWPKADEPGFKACKRSDHRLVWIDIKK